jgi:ATP-binding cassette subfamily F protein uup
VSHDRAFLDSIATQCLVAEGDGRWKEYAGGYSDWLAQRPAPVEIRAPQQAGAKPAVRRERASRDKLSGKERRELEALPARIESLETEQGSLQQLMAGADYHRRGTEQLRLDRARLDRIESELEASFLRWSELEARAQAAD